MKKIIETLDNLPALGKGEKQVINKSRLIEAAEKVRKILLKSEREKRDGDESFSSRANAYNC